MVGGNEAWFPFADRLRERGRAFGGAAVNPEAFNEAVGYHQVLT
jgi:hypothetical protein